MLACNRARGRFSLVVSEMAHHTGSLPGSEVQLIGLRSSFLKPGFSLSPIESLYRLVVAILLRSTVLLLLLGATACAEHQVDRGDQAGLSNEIEPPESSGAETHASDSSTAQEDRMISIDIIGGLFPATAADASNMSSLASLFGSVFQLDLKGCMADAGFQLDLPDLDLSRRHYDFPDLDLISSIGFGFSQSLQSPASAFDPLENIPLELREQFRTDQDRCYLAYVEEHGDPMAQIEGVAGTLQSLWYNELAAIDSSPEIVAEFLTWRQCMADGGHRVDSHESFFPELDITLLGLLGDDPQAADLEAARAEELAAAELYVACMQPLEAVRQPIRDEARRLFLEDNAEEVRAIEELADRLIAEVQQR